MGTSSLTIFKCNRNCCKPAKNQVAIEPHNNIQHSHMQEMLSIYIQPKLIFLF
ncbi:hypothetical protein HanPSC8_Chr04g0149721 [Helianthus annuus]|nr:hypothetical protein HanPSC8_Chr04g0149721 [Helianthus annuus]